MSLAIEEWFSASMPQADAAFRRAWEPLRPALELIRHPEPGPNGEALHVGVAYLGPRRPRAAVVVVSGEHGIEGYAGAGAQNAIAWRLRDAGLPDGCGLLVVHQLNPYGCAWNRREDHENVDVFRNLVYADHPSQMDPLYPALDPAINLTAWLGPERERADALLDDQVRRHGAPRVVQAIRRGQHAYPLGMTYHGSGRCWSNRLLRDLVSARLAGAERLYVIDFHTGFGPPGEGMIVSFEEEGARDLALLRRLFGEVYSPGADPLVQAHRAALPWSFVKDVLPGVRWTVVGVEYGTRDEPDLLRIARACHYFHLHGDRACPEAVAAAAAFRSVFYVEEPGWKRAVARRGLDVWDTTVAALGREMRGGWE